MMRRSAASFGVALVATFVQYRTWTHRLNLIATRRSTTAPLRDGRAVTQG